jgi:hypothetical protein
MDKIKDAYPVWLHRSQYLMRMHVRTLLHLENKLANEKPVAVLILCPTLLLVVSNLRFASAISTAIEIVGREFRIRSTLGLESLCCPFPACPLA